jgi:hypothetical protein
LDHAVARFVAGDYAATVAEMEAIAAASTDEAVRREAYTYLGRAHVALGHTDEAVAAFSRGVQQGDRGPCVAYLELLKQYVEGSPGTLHTREFLTRGELAGAIVRLMDAADASHGPTPAGPTPLQTAAARGWMPVLPDGGGHADDLVTRAVLYVVVARILAEAGRADELETVLPGGYGSAMRARGPVSGTEALAVLERTRSLLEGHGR